MEWNMVQTPEGLRKIRLRGEMDLYAAPKALKLILGFLEAGDKAIHLDLAEVNYLDSSGVGVLIRILQHAKTKAAAITFSGIQGTPRKVLTLSNILPLLKETDGGLIKRKI